MDKSSINTLKFDMQRYYIKWSLVQSFWKLISISKTNLRIKTDALPYVISTPTLLLYLFFCFHSWTFLPFIFVIYATLTFTTSNLKFYSRCLDVTVSKKWIATDICELYTQFWSEEWKTRSVNVSFTFTFFIWYFCSWF